MLLLFLNYCGEEPAGEIARETQSICLHYHKQRKQFSPTFHYAPIYMNHIGKNSLQCDRKSCCREMKDHESGRYTQRKSLFIFSKRLSIKRLPPSLPFSQSVSQAKEEKETRAIESECLTGNLCIPLPWILDEIHSPCLASPAPPWYGTIFLYLIITINHDQNLCMPIGFPTHS